MSKKKTGKITNYNEDRGFGFILTPNNEEEFFHFSECDFLPKVGLKVTYEPGKDRSGRSKAYNIQCVQGEESKDENAIN